MRITEIRVTLYGDNRLKAFVHVTFDDAFIIHGLKVIDGPKGLFVSMPSRSQDDGTYQDICHPLNGPMRESIEKLILFGYKRAASAVPKKTTQFYQFGSDTKFDITSRAVQAEVSRARE